MGSRDKEGKDGERGELLLDKVRTQLFLNQNSNSQSSPNVFFLFY